MKWNSDCTESQWWKNSIREQVFRPVTKASQNLENCPIHWLWMVNALSRQSLFLLRVEEMSQTIRGAEMECVSKLLCKIHGCRIMIVFLPYQHQKCSSVSWIRLRKGRISIVTRQELLANQGSFLPSPLWPWESRTPVPLIMKQQERAGNRLFQGCKLSSH